MKLLILGGTRFVGRHMVEAALGRGHEVTLFNRGQSNSDLFPEVESLRGDRDGNLSALEGRKWEAVIDTCGYVPRLVRASAELLANAVERYIFISTISVYRTPYEYGMDENSPLGTLEDASVEEITGETYGPLKVLCEQAAEEALPGRVLIVRPGLIVGPYDQTDRFTYWPERIAAGGDVLAPGDPEQPVQLIDGRDLAEWTLHMVETRATGIYHATGPDYGLTVQQCLTECQSTTGSDAHLTWLNEEFLLANKVSPFTEIPLWLPKNLAILMTLNVQKAIHAALTFRPLAQTIRDTLAWHATRPKEHQWRAGLTPPREQELLHKWHEELRIADRGATANRFAQRAPDEE